MIYTPHYTIRIWLGCGLILIALSGAACPTLAQQPVSGFDSNLINQSAIPMLDLLSDVVAEQDRVVITPVLNENNERMRAEGLDIVRQRFQDGKIRIRRWVAQDEQGNVFNHGLWEAFDREGLVVARGNYDQGRLEGPWMRKHAIGSDGLFKTRPFNRFPGPYYSVAEFKQGHLDGTWRIFDSFPRLILEIPYRAGKRQGIAIWQYPNGIKMRTAQFNNGLIDGQVVEWDDMQKLVGRDEYDEGRKIIRTTSFYRPGQKESEDYFLDAKLVPDGLDDWWDAQPATFLPQGSRTQSGSSMAWYPNNQPRKKGQFKDGIPFGQFTWWHENGNIKTQGMYAQGKKTDHWIWWYDTGLKQYEGSYKDDAAVGAWKSWDAEGNIQKEEDFPQESESQTVLDTDPKSETEKTEEIEETGGDPVDDEELDFSIETLPDSLDIQADDNSARSTQPGENESTGNLPDGSASPEVVPSEVVPSEVVPQRDDNKEDDTDEDRPAGKVSGESVRKLDSENGSELDAETGNDGLEDIIPLTLAAPSVFQTVENDSGNQDADLPVPRDQDPDSPRPENMDVVVIKSFRAVHDGWSSDEVILNDELNLAFIRACHSELPDVSAFDLNWRLMNLRKAGKLKTETTKSNRTSVADVSHIAEIAARSMHDRHSVSTDQIMANPDYRAEFDEIARSIAQTDSNEERAYRIRKAAFRLRKSRKLRPELIARIADWGRGIETFSVEQILEDPDRVKERPGIYIFRDKTGYLYIGQTDNLRKRLKSHLDHSHNASLADYLSDLTSDGVTIEIHSFDPDSRAKETMVRRAYESELIASRKPRFNIQP